MVAVGNRLFWSDKWKTVPDFLGHYIKTILDPAWGNAELTKPLAERHPVMQWYDAYCRHQRKYVTTPGQVSSGEVTGAVACYLGLAYSLYLLDHNVELQTRLVRRLKNSEQFQGAYYELMVANSLIRAGFELTLEDEENGATKHCEFAAISKRTKRKYWVEAKMRAVSGLLGRTGHDGTSSTNPISKLIPHLNAALAKPAADRRLIFIDLNTPTPPDCSMSSPPPFIAQANRRLREYEDQQLPSSEAAYLFVTNLDFHRDLTGSPQMVVVPYGLGIPDFNRSGVYRMSEIYRRDQEHVDALDIAESMAELITFPVTFDGALPSSILDRTSRIIIGEHLAFTNDKGENLIGLVTTACVLEPEAAAYVGVAVEQGANHIVKVPLTPAELKDYAAHPDAFFGKILPVGGHAKSPYDLFKFFIGCYSALTRDQLLDRLTTMPSDMLAAMTDQELLACYCEGLVGSVQSMHPQSRPASPVTAA